MDKVLKVAVLLSAVDKMSSVIQSGADQGIKHLTRLNKQSARLADRSFATARAAAGVGLAFAGPIGLAVNAAAEMETMNVALKTAFQGNEQAANKAFNQISQFAAKTPYEMGEVMTSFIKLKNMGLDPSIEALTAYGNTASGMGKSLNDMIEAVADAATGEFERLKEFGIRSKSNGDKVSFTFQGVTTTVKKNSKEIEAYLKNIGATKFAGGIEAQSQTWNGRFSTMKDTMRMFLADIGKKFIPILTELASKIMPVLDKIKIWMDKNPALTKYIVYGTLAVTALSFAITILSLVFGGLMKIVQFVINVVQFFARVVRLASATLRIMTIVTRFSITAFSGFYRGVVSAVRSLFSMSVASRIQAASQAVLSTVTSIGTGIMYGLGAAVTFVGNVTKWLSAVMMNNPIILIITIIATLTFLIIKNWTGIKKFFSELWESVKKTFSEFWNWLTGWASKPVRTVVENWDKIKKYFSNLWEAVKLPFVKFWNWLSGLGKRFVEAGANIVKSIWNGIKSGWDKMVNWFKGGIQKLRDMLPFSPAKTGPFRDLHRVKIVETIAQNIKPGPMVSAMEKSVAPVRNMFPKKTALSSTSLGLSPAGSGSGGSSTGVVINFNPTINMSGPVGPDTKGQLLSMLGELKPELMRLIKEATDQQERRRFA